MKKSKTSRKSERKTESKAPERGRQLYTNTAKSRNQFFYDMATTTLR